MYEHLDELVASLLAENSQLDKEKAVWWVEMLWNDFESSYAKAGYPYKGPDYTADYVAKQIKQHGKHLHEINKGENK